MYRQWLKDKFSPEEIAQLGSQKDSQRRPQQPEQRESQHTSPEAAEEQQRRVDSMEPKIDPIDVSPEETGKTDIGSSHSLRLQSAESGSIHGHRTESDPGSSISQRLPTSPGSSQSHRSLSGLSQRVWSALGMGSSQRSQSSEPGTSHSQRVQSGLSSIRSSQVEDSATVVPDERDITAEVMQQYREDRDRNALAEAGELKSYKDGSILNKITLTPRGHPVVTRTRSDVSYEGFMGRDKLKEQSKSYQDLAKAESRFAEENRRGPGPAPPARPPNQEEPQPNRDDPEKPPFDDKDKKPRWR